MIISIVDDYPIKRNDQVIYLPVIRIFAIQWIQQERCNTIILFNSCWFRI